MMTSDGLRMLKINEPDKLNGVLNIVLLWGSLENMIYKFRLSKKKKVLELFIEMRSWIVTSYFQAILVQPAAHNSVYVRILH